MWKYDIGALNKPDLCMTCFAARFSKRYGRKTFAEAWAAMEADRQPEKGE